MSSQLSILAESVELLRGLLEEWAGRQSGSKAKDIRRSFINRHAWNIHDLAEDVLVLAEAGKLGSIHLLSRPALESLFKLGAAVKDEKFAAQKVVAEIEEERDKVGYWRAAAEAGWVATLDKMSKLLVEFGDELRTRYGVTGQRKWKVFEVAKVGKLEAEYVRDYFVGSKHVHVMLSALTDREDQLYVPEALYRLTALVSHASALVNKALIDLENCVAPEVFNTALELHRRAKTEFDATSSAQTAVLKAQGY